MTRKTYPSWFGTCFLIILMTCMIAPADNQAFQPLTPAFKATRSFDVRQYTPGQSIEVEVTLTIEHIGDPACLTNHTMATPGYINQIYYQETYPKGVIFYDDTIDRGQKGFHSFTHHMEGNEFAVFFNYHYAWHGKQRIMDMPLTVSYFIEIPAEATGDLSFTSEKCLVGVSYYKANASNEIIPATLEAQIVGEDTITSTAPPEPQTYAVHYLKNDGSETLPYTVTDLLPGNHAVATYASTNLGLRDGFDFIGWNTLADGNGDAYAEGDTLAIADADVTLYAQWEQIKPPTYAVTYHKNDGSHVPPFVVNQVLAGPYTVAAYATTNLGDRAGFTFTGWNTSAQADGTAYAAGDTLTITDDNVELFAQWAPITYQITYRGNGGQTPDGLAAYSSAPIRHGTAYVLDDNRFTKAYFTFTGWNYANGSAVVGNTITVTQNMTLSARWTQKSVVITYEPGAGATFTGQRKVTADAGSVYTVTAQEPTRENFRFLGWKLNGQTVGATIKLEEQNITLTAAWEDNTPKKSSLVLHMGENPQFFVKDTPSVTSPIEVQVGSAVAPDGADYFKPYAAMTFKGWALEDIPGAPIAYQAGQELTLEADQTLHLHAVWDYYADVTLAGVVRADFDFQEGEQNLITNPQTPRIAVSNSTISIGNGTVASQRDAILWFRMLNYGFINAPAFKLHVTLTDPHQTTWNYNRGTILRAVKSWQGADYVVQRTYTEELVDGMVSNGLTSDGNAVEDAVVSINLGQLKEGNNYQVTVHLDVDDQVEEAEGTNDAGEVAGGNRDNDITFFFNVTKPVPSEYSVTYGDLFLYGLELMEAPIIVEKTKQSNVLPFMDALGFDTLRLHEIPGLEGNPQGFKCVSWMDAKDSKSFFAPGTELPRDKMELIAVWDILPTIWFYPFDDNPKNTDPQNILKLSQKDDTTLMAYAQSKLDFWIVNFSDGIAPPFKLNFLIKRIADGKVFMDRTLGLTEAFPDNSVIPANLSIPALPPGEYTLTGFTDPLNEISEAFEEDSWTFPQGTLEDGTYFKKIVLPFTVQAAEQATPWYPQLTFNGDSTRTHKVTITDSDSTDILDMVVKGNLITPKDYLDNGCQGLLNGHEYTFAFEDWESHAPVGKPMVVPVNYTLPSTGDLTASEPDENGLTTITITMGDAAGYYLTVTHGSGRILIPETKSLFTARDPNGNIIAIENLTIQCFEAGTYTISARACNPAGKANTAATCQIQVAVPSQEKPGWCGKQFLPKTGEIRRSDSDRSNILFSWPTVNTAVAYDLFIFDASGRQATAFKNLNTTHQALELKAGAYFWRVVAMDQLGTKIFSQDQELTIVQGHEQPALLKATAEGQNVILTADIPGTTNLAYEIKFYTPESGWIQFMGQQALNAVFDPQNNQCTLNLGVNTQGGYLLIRPANTTGQPKADFQLFKLP